MARPSKLARLEREETQRNTRRSAKRSELARHAMHTLSQLGYARTSLRDIAEQSGCSVGLIHYYFEDKVDLILCCVRLYKTGFIEQLDTILAQATADGEVLEQFVEGLCHAVASEPENHRLWYDIRAQALFDPRFREETTRIEGELHALIGRLLQALDVDPMLTSLAYTALDGSFRYALYQQLDGDGRSLEVLRHSAQTFLAGLSTMKK